MIDNTSTGKHRRIQASSVGFTGLPALRAVHHRLLQRWLASDTQERAWQSLLKAAGTEYLDHTETLLGLLLEAGALKVKQTFKNGQWWPERIVWADLPALQKAMGIQPAEERDALRTGLQQQLRALAQEQPWMARAVANSLALPTTSLQARAPLLHALVAWQAEQGFGLRQDFALFARPHTKAISPTEWMWLETSFDLESLRIGRFAPLLWLSGAISLQSPHGRLDAAALGLLALPVRRLAAPVSVVAAPSRYWLIENRASFERCAPTAPAGHCVVWLPGRPSQDWLRAMEWLLDHAPAPADISCDPDPAGIEIALTAGQLWHTSQLPWHSKQMDPECWQHGKTLPLNRYDQQTLERLALRNDLPSDLAALRDFLQLKQYKAEQEGWM